MHLFENVSPNKWDAIVDGLLKFLKREGPLKLVERCAKALPDGLKECAFSPTPATWSWPTAPSKPRRKFLDHLQQALGLDADSALTIVEVMITKNKG